MNVTSELMKEHELIVEYIHLLQEYIANSKDTPLVLEKGQDFVRFFRNFADRFHHAKEEDILFKHMETGNALTHCNPLPQMLYEHDEGRQAVTAMEQAVLESRQDAFNQAAVRFSRLLVDHIYKEDNILYLMAEEGLSDADKAVITQAYEAAEADIHSKEIWRHYKAQLASLKEYLHEHSGVGHL